MHSVPLFHCLVLSRSVCLYPLSFLFMLLPSTLQVFLSVLPPVSYASFLRVVLSSCLAYFSLMFDFIFCSVPFRSGLSSFPSVLIWFFPFHLPLRFLLSLALYLSLSLSLSLSLPLSVYPLSLALYVSFHPHLSWCLSLLPLGLFPSRPAVMPFGLQTLLPTYLPPSLPSFLHFSIHPCPSPVVSSFLLSSLPSFLPSSLPLVSFMSSRQGGNGERTHRHTGEHAEKREWTHGRRNDKR